MHFDPVWMFRLSRPGGALTVGVWPKGRDDPPKRCGQNDQEVSVFVVFNHLMFGLSAALLPRMKREVALFAVKAAQCLNAFNG